jgi:hypothetical protein
VNGTAEIIDSEPRLSELMAYIVKRNSPGLGDHLAEHVANMVRKRVVVAVTPDKTISWDHRKIAAKA